MCECECCDCCEDCGCGKKCCTTTWVIVSIVSALVLIITLIATSVKKLENYEVGLDYNPNAVEINESKLYTEGTYMLGPGHSFITFNRQ